ncbi:M48 family metallopeptidase [candidate division KSB1 bacterium]
MLKQLRLFTSEPHREGAAGPPEITPPEKTKLTGDTIVVDDIVYPFRRSRRRRTVGITINRQGSVTIAAPARCPLYEIRGFVRQKRPWINKKLAERDELLRRKKTWKFIDGERFAYLGRDLPLKLITSENGGEDGEGEPPLVLRDGFFLLNRDEQPRGRDHFIRWYHEQAALRLGELVELYRGRLGVSVKEVRIKDFKSKWGSCHPNGTISFDWRIIMFPPEIAEYIVLHELVHLLHPNHQKPFWKSMETLMPDCIERRKWLSRQGVLVDI